MRAVTWWCRALNNSVCCQSMSSCLCNIINVVKQIFGHISLLTQSCSVVSFGPAEANSEWFQYVQTKRESGGDRRKGKRFYHNPGLAELFTWRKKARKEVLKWRGVMWWWVRGGFQKSELNWDILAFFGFCCALSNSDANFKTFKKRNYFFHFLYD